MKSKIMNLTLTTEERNILIGKVNLPENLKSIILSTQANSKFSISEDDACDIIDCVTDTLDLIGFDCNDEPTADGLILESLVDKFLRQPNIN